MPALATGAADGYSFLGPRLERAVTAELRRSDDQLMVTLRIPREAATTALTASIAFIAHRIV
ncbi:MAG: hypothetical protein WCD69_27135 [Xanthobacteraceae bacterium]